MTLVFGGTTEGKIVASLLNSRQQEFLYSTKTKVEELGHDCGKMIHGAMGQEEMGNLCKKESCRFIIDAAHPFAVELHATIHAVSTQLSIPVIRFERKQIEKIDHALVHYVSNYDEAIDTLRNLGSPSLLALSGVQSIAQLIRYWKDTICYFRILARPESIEIAERSFFPKKRLILDFQSIKVKDEVKLINELNINSLLIKESGGGGQFETKIKAALEQQIPVIVLEKPVLPRMNITVFSEEELEQELIKKERA